MEIDGTSTEGMSPDKAVDVLTGRPGTEVKLSLLHEGTEQAETVAIHRAIIEVPSVLGDHRGANDQWEFLIDKEKKIGYVRSRGSSRTRPTSCTRRSTSSRKRESRA